MSRSLQILFVPGLILGFCIVYAYRNRAVPAQDMMLVTPVTVLLIALVLAEAARSLRAGESGGLTWQAARQPLTLLLIVALFIFGAQYDFILAGAGFTLAALVTLGERRAAVLAGNTLVLPVALFYLFHEVMRVPLPSVVWT